MSDEVIVTNKKTGGKKGAKKEHYAYLPWEQLREVARVYAMGAQKYEPYNWQKGYDWDLSFSALIRHAEEFWMGTDTDEESGLHPLAHAVFHCLTLMFFSEHHSDLDTRPKPVNSDDEYKYVWNGAPCKILCEYMSPDGQNLLTDIEIKSNKTKYTGLRGVDVIYNANN